MGSRYYQLGPFSEDSTGPSPGGLRGFARLADEAGVPCLLVGDSMGMTMLGYETTLPVKMEETLSAVAAVARAAKNALVVADMPFGSYQCGDDLAMANAVALHSH